MPDTAPSRFHFLYRSDAGRVDRAQWARAALPIVLIFAAATAAMLESLPYANRPLTERAFLDLATLATNIYMMVYATLTLFLGISWVNLAAKRFRDRGRQAPVGLAGLLPFAMLVAGGIAWLQPRVADVMPRWTVWSCEAVVAVVALWTIAELLDMTRGR